jgi:hypothetical protein
MSDYVGDTGGSVIFSMAIDDQLEQERARKVSLEQRAITVITSSGVLVSLLFGFTAVVDGDEPTEFGKVLLGAALLFFVAATILSLLANRPRDYVPLSVKKDLVPMVTDDEIWQLSADDARRSLAEFRVREMIAGETTITPRQRYYS